MFVTINIKHAFTSTRDKIRFPVMEVLLCTASGDLVHYNNLNNWEILDIVFLQPLLTKAVILYDHATATEILDTFSAKISEHQVKTLE